MGEKMSNELRQAFTVGRELAVRYKDSKLKVEHVLYGIITSKNIIYELLYDKVTDYDLLIHDINNYIKKQSDNDVETNNETILKFEPTIYEVLMVCSKQKNKEEFISVELFFTVSFDLSIAIIKIIKDYGITKTFIKQKLKQLNIKSMYFSDEENGKKNSQNDNQTNKTKTKTPILDNFGRDLTALANEDKLDPIIGRGDEVERVAQILARRTKNNPMLLGDPGVGKCFVGDTIVTLRNDVSNKLIKLPINVLLIKIKFELMVQETSYTQNFLPDDGYKKFTKSWDIENFSILTNTGFEKIVKFHQTIPYVVFHLVLENGYELKCADNHIVMCESLSPDSGDNELIEVFVKDLNHNYRVMTDVGFKKIKSVTNLNYDEIMYDFQLSDDSNHVYYTNGILSHNTAIAEGLAIKIANNECPRPLQGKRLIALDLTSMVAGTKYRGQFEERIKGLLDEVRDNPNIILFVDELHTLVGAGNSSGSLDAANVFKPALARGEIQCIGATTLNEYREHIEKDGALDRRFQKIIVNPTTLKETREILMHIREKYQDFHNVEYTDEAIDEIIRLSDRYITNREFPDKAIDILDEAGSRTQINIKPPEKIKELEEKLKQIKKQKTDVVKSQNYEKAADLRDLEKKTIADLDKETKLWRESIFGERMIVTDDMVCEVVSMMTGIPISKISQNEIKKLINIDKEISNTIIGQDDAVQKVASAIKRNRTGIRKQNRPIGTFLFIGGSGVGKTELAKVLAEKIFGGEDSMIRIDMSEYSEKFNTSKLIGSPPGYIGYNEGGQLTEKVKNKPYSLILFDEIEKAHPEIFNILLQLLDEGHLTDNSGRKVNFKNTIIIMTSNIGLKDVQDFGVKIGFSTNKDSLNSSQDIIEKALKKTFKPEFLNRLDEIVYFNHLGQNEILKIIDLQLNDLAERLKESNYTFKISKSAKDKLAELGFNKNYGARELQRTIQKYIEDPMSDELLKNNMPNQCHFNITYDTKKEKFILNVLDI